MIFDKLLKRQSVDKTVKRANSGRRSYAAARGGRLFGDFLGGSNSADAELRHSLETMRNRSRELVRDNEFARRYMSLLKTNVVGDGGFKLQVKARNEPSNILDTLGNQIIEDAWHRWGKLGNPTADGRMSWIDCQRYVIEAVARDGECFVKKVIGPKYHDGFALQFIEADLIDESKNEDLANGSQIRMGIEVDKTHRPIAYFIKNGHPGDRYFTGKDNKSLRVPADEIYHIYMPTRTHQTRGEPFMVSAMSAMKHLSAYREAEVIAARIASSKMGMITTPGDEFIGDGEDTDGNTPVIDITPGSFHQLPAGHNLTMFDPDHPTTGFKEFESQMLKGIASGLGVSYAALSSDLSSVNYSSIRQGALDERDGYKAIQRFMIEHFCQPIFSDWLQSALDFGDLPIPPARFNKFNNASSFRGRGWNWVDPAKEMSASIMGLNNGLLSLQDVAANSGKDVEEIFSQVSRDKELAEQFGISMSFEPFGGGQSGYGPMKFNPMLEDEDNE